MVILTPVPLRHASDQMPELQCLFCRWPDYSSRRTDAVAEQRHQPFLDRLMAHSCIIVLLCEVSGGPSHPTGALRVAQMGKDRVSNRGRIIGGHKLRSLWIGHDLTDGRDITHHKRAAGRHRLDQRPR